MQADQSLHQVPKSWSTNTAQNHEIVIANKNQNMHATYFSTDVSLRQETYVSLPANTRPVSIEWTPNGKLLIAEKQGKIHFVDNGVLSNIPFLDISKIVSSHAGRGLLGFAVHPQFPDTPYVYALYTYDPPETFQYANNINAKPDGEGQRVVRLSRYTADAANNHTTVISNSEIVLVGKNSTWETIGDPFQKGIDVTDNWSCFKNNQHIKDCIPQEHSEHGNGDVTFLNDGSLVFSTGDSTSGTKTYDLVFRTLDLNSFAGKVLRVDPETGLGLSDNPFYDGNPESTRSKVYNLGLRNPWRMTVHPETNELYIADVGWHLWEEINTGSGKNFGWPCYEGGNEGLVKTGSYKARKICTDLYATTDVTQPFYSWSHPTSGGAVVVGSVYTGDTYPVKYKGALFFGDFDQREIRTLFLNEASSRQEYFTSVDFPLTDIKQGPDGNLYLVDIQNSRVVRMAFSN